MIERLLLNIILAVLFYIQIYPWKTRLQIINHHLLLTNISIGMITANEVNNCSCAAWHQRSLISIVQSVSIIVSLLALHLPLPITVNQLLLSNSSLKFVGLQLSATDHPLASCYSVCLVSSVLLFKLPSTITPNQLLLSISCLKIVALQLVINNHY
jgi:hypothetical protein